MSSTKELQAHPTSTAVLSIIYGEELATFNKAAALQRFRELELYDGTDDD